MDSKRVAIRTKNAIEDLAEKQAAILEELKALRAEIEGMKSAQKPASPSRRKPRG